MQNGTTHTSFDLVDAVQAEVARAGECIDIDPRIARVAAERGYSLAAAERATIAHALDQVSRAHPGLEDEDRVRVTATVLVALAHRAERAGVRA